MGRQLSFGSSSGKRTYVQAGEFSKFDINAGQFIDAFLLNGPTIGKLGGAESKTTDVGSAINGVEFVELQSVMEDGVEIMNFMCLRNNGTLFDIGKKVENPHSVMKPHGNPKYLINYVNSGAYIQGIGFQQVRF